MSNILHIFTLPGTAEAFFDGQFSYLTEKLHNITVVANDEFDSDFVKRNKISCLVAPIVRSISPITDIKTIWSLRSLIHRNGYDAVFGHTPKGAMVAMFAAKLAGVKNRIYYRHGLIYTTAKGIKRFVFKMVEQLTAACATRVVNVSPSLSKLAVKDHLNSEKKQCVIGQGTCGGIDAIDLFNPERVSGERVSEIRKSLNIPNEAFVVGFCGRLCRDKGIIELIEGFKYFREAHPDIETRLLLVGHYDARDILPQNIKEEIAANPFIISTGEVSHDILPNYYSLMDVFVFPSYREGFGMTVIEASAMCIPILVSRSHGCVDSIQEFKTGEYIDLSPEGVKIGLESMLDDRKMAIYGANGRKWVVDNFDYRVMWPLINELYSVICGTTSCEGLNHDEVDGDR